MPSPTNTASIGIAPEFVLYEAARGERATSASVTQDQPSGYTRHGRQRWRQAGVANPDASIRACESHSIAITETGASRSPKTIDGDHPDRFIAIDGAAHRGDPPELLRGSLQA